MNFFARILPYAQMDARWRDHVEGGADEGMSP
jgi:hypothetical protein